MVQPDNLVYNTGDYSITAYSSFTVPVNGNYHFSYEVDPMSMDIRYGAGQSLQICSDCYYDLLITVTNDCGEVVGQETHGAGTVFDTLCAPPAISGNFSLANLAIGIYNVRYRLQISKAALDFYDERFVRTNTDLRTWADFTREALKSTDFGNCFADCQTCKASLGTREGFAARFTGLFSQFGISYDTDYQDWVDHLYDSLYAHCEAIACPGNSSVCYDNYKQMLADVSPGGQYALYDSAYQMVEPDINILQYYTTTLFTDINGNPDSVYNGQGALVPPARLSLKAFILNFNPAWADSLVTRHPEFCFYKWCLANSASKEYDDLLLNGLQDAASATEEGLFDPGDYLKLFESDPFFQSTGLGYYLAGKMQDSMTYYSKTMGMPYDNSTALPVDLSIDTRDPNISLYQASHYITFNQGFSSVADDDFKAVIIPGSQYKHGGYYDILGVAKWLATCGQIGMPIDSCVVCRQCINRDLVWNTYKNLYLQLKAKMYREAMANSDNPVFRNCTNCYIGTDGPQGGLGFTDDILEQVTASPAIDPSIYQTTVRQRTATASKDSPSKLQSDTAAPRIISTIHAVMQPNDVGYSCPSGIHFSFQDLGEDGACYTDEHLFKITYSGGSAYPNVTAEVTISFKNQDGYSPYSFTVAFNSTETVKYYCVPKQVFIGYPQIYGPLTPTMSGGACSDMCPDGAYTTTMGDDVYILKGQEGEYPENVPQDYGNCTFIEEYSGVQGDECLFTDVWVCPVKDSEFPAYCPDDPRAPLYAGKHRVYNDYFDFSGQQDDLLAADPDSLKQAGVARADSAAKANIAYEADLWAAELSACTADTSLLGQLKRGMIAVAQAACDSAHPNGASTLPTGVTATADGRTYTSFDDVIIQVMGIQAVNDSCTSDLINSPYPYGQEASFADVPVVKTDSSICAKLSGLKNDWQAGGFPGSFHDFLKAHLGNDYTLSETQLTELEQSCTICHYLIAENLTLPAVFGADAAQPVSCSAITAALSELTTKYPALTDSNPRYPTILTNFLNHQFSYSLAYYDYLYFRDSVCPVNSVASLYNQSAVPVIQVDSNACIAEQFGLAVTNAAIAYQAYIDSVHRDFREGFLTKCMNVQPRLTMTGSLWEYQYTLYYYDQAGNLVETVPPAGVKLLSREQVDSVQLYRKYGRKDCYLYSNYYNIQPPPDTSAYFRFNPTTSGYVTAFEPFTLELWIKLNDFSDQGIAGNLRNTEVEDSTFYSAGYSIIIKDGKLKLAWDAGRLYKIDDSIIPSHRVLGETPLLANYMQADEWTHIVFESTGTATPHFGVYVNGTNLPLAYTLRENTGDYYFGPVAALTLGAARDTSDRLYGLKDAALKQFRLYNRYLTYSEIRQNLYSICLTPSNRAGLIQWVPLNDTSVTDLAGGEPGEKAGDASWFSLDQALWPMYPKHELVSRYAYNSLNEVVRQKSPDGGITQSWYDRLGRLTASQNSEQRNPLNGGASGRYSYTKYDALGRVIEVGEKSGAADLNTIDTKNSAAVSAWLASGTNSQAIFTRYDSPDPDNTTISQDQTNLRKRVAGSYYSEDGDWEDYDAATHYSYDIAGNVKTLWQDIPALQSIDAANGLKRIDYDYDIISGKVNEVAYQKGKGDQFFYRYTYDADNRVIAAATSRDGLLWHDDARYRYYLHGPLARMELGADKVQGVDYAYTLQGWLKGINGNAFSPVQEAADMAGDGNPSGIYAPFARDVYGLSLGYYDGDYSPVGSGAGAFDLSYDAPETLNNTGNELFNGNISHTTLALSDLNSGLPVGYSYGYDQLNRLLAMRQHSIGGSATSWDNGDIINDYREDVAYDANGNILKYLRNGTTAGSNPLGMDSLTYFYNDKTNQLNVIHDSVPAGNYAVDLDNQSVNNYAYDSIGNLIKDNAGSINGITWTVYGKPKQITKGSGSIDFNYDAGGNRILKDVDGSKQYYIRDAQGNVLSVYSYDGTDLKWAEQDLYGSSRLGTWNWNTAVPGRVMLPENETDTLSDWYLLGSRDYELTNHLGNVLNVITDKKIGVSSGGSVIDYYKAEVLSQQDYYVFGVEQPVRSFNTRDYAYGFNGKRMDNEIYGTGNFYDYGMRMYDPRVGRFLSVDPLTQKYPELTPYQFASNRPIDGIDLNGMEYLSAKDAIIEFKYGEVRVKIKSLHNVTQHIIYNMMNDPQYWPPGKIGANLTVESLSMTLPKQMTDPRENIGNGVNYENGYGAPDPTNITNPIPIERPVGRGSAIAYNEPAIPSIAPSRLAGGVALALNLVTYTVQTTSSWLMSNDINTINSQNQKYTPWVIDDINTALLKGNIIPPKYQNKESLTNIANVILQGVNNTKDKNIYSIGMRIFDEISLKRFAKIGTMESHMDNYPSKQFVLPEIKTKDH